MRLRKIGNVEAAGPSPEHSLSRRRFLRNSAAGGAAASLLLKTGKSVIGGGATPEGVVRCAIIGFGEMGEALRSAALVLKDQMRFVAVADIWQVSLRNGVGRIRASGQGSGEDGNHCEGYEDGALMLAEEDLHAVFIATPPFFHRHYTKMAFEAGSHVYCEKPISNSIEDARSACHAKLLFPEFVSLAEARAVQ
jgi:hypothetical protein